MRIVVRVVLGEAHQRRDALAHPAELPAVLARLEIAGLDGGGQGQRHAVEDRRHEPVLQRLVPEARAIQRSADLDEELLAGERLQEHSGRALPQCPDRAVHGGVTGRDDHRDFGIAGTDLVPGTRGRPFVACGRP